MQRLLGVLAGVCGALFCFHVVVGTADARRVALVIGNAEYKVGPLANPVNDATAVAEAFGKLGFDKVLLRKNLGAEAFRAALLEMSRESAGAELGVVYFAGHGTEVAGTNFLIPVDARLVRASDLSLETIALDTVLEQLAGVTRLKLVILDACRNNLFPVAGGKRSVTRGLSRIEPEDNTLVVYAAKDGTTAEDGAGRRHSPFTESLLKHIATPDLEINFVFRRVRDDVVAATSPVQTPHVYGTLGGREVYLRPQAAPSGAGPLAERPLPPLGDAVVFRDCFDCPEMVMVPAGDFLMGSPSGEEGRSDSEGPQRRVTIRRPFAVGKFEVTFAEWRACAAAGGCRTDAFNRAADLLYSRFPVEVMWRDANEYASWLSRKTGKPYRLLSEAEWEYVARAGTTTRYPFGDTITTGQAKHDGKHAREVGSFPANRFGLHDMHGNALEWVQDCWNATYSGAPTDGSAWIAGDCSVRVLRGGSYSHGPNDIRSASRYRRGDHWLRDEAGFRLARSLTP